MAKKTMVVSDMSGEAIEDGKGAVITVRYNDARRGQVVLDVTDSEADAVAVKGRKQARRGRKPKDA